MFKKAARLSFVVLIMLLGVVARPGSAGAQAVTPTPGPVFGRPQLAVTGYFTDVGSIQYGDDFMLFITLENKGLEDAQSAQAVFSSSELAPLNNGGVVVIGSVGEGDSKEIGQSMRLLEPLWGKTSVTLNMSVTYYDYAGATYSETFVITLDAEPPHLPNPTATSAQGARRSQLIVSEYGMDVAPLQPGVQFVLSLTVTNRGTAPAKGVTMIIGGGSAAGGVSGTPEPGGISGGSGEFSNFAPVGSSNIQSIGTLEGAQSLVISQKLIVNVSTNPGAYPMKITFSYTDEKGNTVNDDQVITLLVLTLPNVEVSFYQPMGSLFVGQPNTLPLQVVNVGKRSAVLGSMKVTTANGTIENGQAFIGNLETGGYFTLDAMVIPVASGPLTLNIVVDYTDDFNQPRTIEKTLDLTVEETFAEPTLEPGFEGGGGGEGMLPGAEETFWQKAWRFILGLLGLDSGTPGTTPDIISPDQSVPQVVPGKGG